MYFNDIIIKHILLNLLNGHNYVCDSILNIKNNLELKDIQNQYIEIHFFNWLTHDLNLRTFIQKNRYLPNILKFKFYYNNNLSLLGLDNLYRRTKSLTDCHKDYWRTIKTNLQWNIMHKTIKYPYQLIFYDIDDIYHNDIFTNCNGIKLSMIEQLNYLEQIYSSSTLYILHDYSDITFFHIDQYIIKYTKFYETDHRLD